MLRLCLGLDKEGIFRKSPSSDELSFVKKAFNAGEKVDLTAYDIDLSAALLKVFIRELPTPLIGLKLSEHMGALPGMHSKKRKNVLNPITQPT